MSIISRETFEKFSEEEKEKVREKYLYELMEGSELDAALLEELFDKEDLHPKPKIKIWEDVEKEYPHFKDDIHKLEHDILYSWDDLREKIIATYKIAKLIELGYGGTVKEEEWKNNQADFIGIYYCPKSKKYEFRVPLLYHFITFRNRELAEEFMHYPENVELLRQYYYLV